MSLRRFHFGMYLKHRRQVSGFALKPFARRVGLAHTTVYRIEIGETDPKLSTLMAIAGAFGETLPLFLFQYLERKN